MTSYCLVENGAITQGPGELPASWRNISGLPKLPDSDLAPLGWLPVIDSPPTFNARAYKVSTTLNPEPTRVVVTYSLTLRTPEELAVYDRTARGPVPTSISPSQMLIGLASEGLVSPQEAIAAATSGAIPASVQAVIDNLPESYKLPATIRWARLTTVDIENPLVQALAASQAWDHSRLEEFFRKYGAA